MASYVQAVGLLVILAVVNGQDLEQQESEAVQWLNNVYEPMKLAIKQLSELSDFYNFAALTVPEDFSKSDLTDLIIQFSQDINETLSLYNWTQFNNETIKKIFKMISEKGVMILSQEEQELLKEAQNKLEDSYLLSTICDLSISPKDYFLEQDLAPLMETSRDYDSLLWAWLGWRQATAYVRPAFTEVIELLNKAAVMSGWSDAGQKWRDPFSAPGHDLQEKMGVLFNELSPLYKQLHVYVRHKLKELYGEDKFPSSGHIPAHLLGNMWGQSWTRLEDILRPFPVSLPLNATPALQNGTIMEMYMLAQGFFTSLGFDPLPETFWENSVLEKPEGRPLTLCYKNWGYTINMYKGTDIRLIQCAKRTTSEFISVHRSIAQAHYMLEYRNQFVDLRGPANPAFAEAVSDVISLSTSTAHYLSMIGLIDSEALENSHTNESNINFLLGVALNKIAFLPYAKIMDEYRWQIFSGNITPETYNTEWWKMRCKYQGISSPVKRTEEDFDAGSKYHILANEPYIKYFVSYVLLFQFHKALCDEAGHTGHLHTCNIFNSTAAGTKLKNMMQMGMSVSWTDALHAVTGTDQLSIEPMVEYFKPLMDWLEVENNRTGASQDFWTDECPTEIPESEIRSSNCGEFELAGYGALYDYGDEAEVNAASSTTTEDPIDYEPPPVPAGNNAVQQETLNKKIIIVFAILLGIISFQG